jgi:hypothetical protein
MAHQSLLNLLTREILLILMRSVIKRIMISTHMTNHKGVNKFSSRNKSCCVESIANLQGLFDLDFWIFNAWKWLLVPDDDFTSSLWLELSTGISEAIFSTTSINSRNKWWWWLRFYNKMKAIVQWIDNGERCKSLLN